MWSLRSLFILCTAMSCVNSAAGLIHASGYEGSEARVSCPYGVGYESYEKYLCKNDCGNEDVFITTTQGKRNRYSIHDDTHRRVFTATISHLSHTDAGKYWCGVTRTGKDIYTEVKLNVKKDSCCDGSTKVQSYETGSVSLSCPYEPADQNSLKYICRGNKPSTCLQQAAITSENQQNRRFTLTDDKSSRKFTATITNLTQEDSGLYLCGVQRNSGLDVFSAVELEVKEWCCVKSNNLSGIVGRPVTIQCPYPPQHRNNRKFLCKGDDRNNCADVVTSQSRFTLQDDVSLGSFTVTITELRTGDAGTYWCVSDSQWNPATYTKIQLSVDTCCDGSTKVQSYETGSVSLSCPYEPADQNSLKYICRGNKPSTCLQQAAITSENQQNRRFTLTDDESSRKFTVTITSLTQEDSGSYLCGVHRNSGLDVFSAVEVEVNEWCCVKSNNLSGIVGRPLTIQCPYPPQHRNNRKFLCKGDHHNNCADMVTSQSRFTLQDDVSLGSFTVTITELRTGDAGTYWCGSDSQWSPANYTKIQLSVVFTQQTSTMMSPNTFEEPDGSQSTQIPGKPIKDRALFHTVVFIVPAVLLILTFALIIVYKYKSHKLRGAEVSTNRDKTKRTEEEEMMHVTDVYANQVIVVSSQQRASKQQGTCDHYDDAGDDPDSVYQNCATRDDIYCNEFYVKGKA